MPEHADAAINEETGHFSPEVRRRWIVDRVLRNKTVDVDELCEHLKVSRMTIHRDLDDLHNQGALRKVRGGATVQPSYLFESDIGFRLRSNVKEKEALARHALTLVEPGQAIMLDDSTTVRALAVLLPAIKPLTIITNCLGIMAQLCGEREIHQISLGGEYMPSFDSYTGLVCENAIASLRANQLFMSASAVSGGVAFHQNQEITKTKEAMMRSSARKILMVDHSKFGKVALHRLTPLDAFDLVLVDSGLEESWLNELGDAHIAYKVVPV